MSQRNLQIRATTEERIVEAAVQLFSRGGFRSTSTRSIARLAGVNEITLFRHFPRKQELYWAASESRLGRLRMSQELQARLEGDEEPRLAVPSIIEFLAEKLSWQSDLARLLYVALFELDAANQPVHRQVFRDELRRMLEPVEDYLARCVAKGRVRCSDAKAATLGLVASVAILHAATDLLNDASSAISDSRQATARCGRFWLEVLLAEGPKQCPGMRQAEIRT